MITKGLFTQLAMILIAVGIGYLYIMPAFNSIGEMQDRIAQYKTERGKIDSVNHQLNQLVDRLDGIPASDQRKLLTYIPDQVDSVAVARLLNSMAQQSGLLIESIDYGEVRSDLMDEVEQTGLKEYPVPHEFSVSAVGTYQQMKNFLAKLEVNEYPLQVHELELSVVQGEFLSADLLLVTYSHLEPEESPFKN